jgi:predicted neuraminidase
MINRMHPASGSLLLRIAIILVAAALFLGFWGFGMHHPAAPRFEAPPPRSEGAPAPMFSERFASGGETPEVHAATAYADRPGSLTGFWYGGTREGARDVAIYRSRLEGDRWDTPRVVVDRAQAQADLNRHIRKLGNPSVYRHPDGRLWLFFVTVSVGGWAGSSISMVESVDNGRSWSKAKRLVTSPLLNLSTLVRGSGFPYADGTTGLPIYHEFAGKFGELLRLDRDGRIIRKTRLSSARDGLQPEVAILSADKAVGLLRYAGAPPPRVLHTVSNDSGRTWSVPQKIHLPNPDSALDVLALGSDRMLAVLNDIDEARWRLVLAISDDLGKAWRVIKVLEQQQDKDDINRYQFSYPWLLRTGNGDFHVLYTWNKSRIKHVEFNQRWLDAASANPGGAGNSGGSGNPGGPGNSGGSGNPGGPGNSGSSGNPGPAGNAGGEPVAEAAATAARAAAAADGAAGTRPRPPNGD